MKVKVGTLPVVSSPGQGIVRITRTVLHHKILQFALCALPLRASVVRKSGGSAWQAAHVSACRERTL